MFLHHFKTWTPGATDMRQLRPSHSSYDQAYPAVTINDLFPGVTVTINSQKFSHPDICNIRPCRCSFSHLKKSIGPMTLSMRNMDDGRGAVLTQSAKVCTQCVRRPPFWLIITALDRNRYLPVLWARWTQLCGVLICPRCDNCLMKAITNAFRTAIAAVE